MMCLALEMYLEIYEWLFQRYVLKHINTRGLIVNKGKGIPQPLLFSLFKMLFSQNDIVFFVEIRPFPYDKII